MSPLVHKTLHLRLIENADATKIDLFSRSFAKLSLGQCGHPVSGSVGGAAGLGSWFESNTRKPSNLRDTGSRTEPLKHSTPSPLPETANSCLVLTPIPQNTARHRDQGSPTYYAERDRGLEILARSSGTSSRTRRKYQGGPAVHEIKIPKGSRE